MNTLLALLALVKVEHMAWNEAFRVGVICKLDGSLCVRWFVDGALYEFAARDRQEVLAIVGSALVSDVGWRLL